MDLCSLQTVVVVVVVVVVVRGSSSSSSRSTGSIYRRRRCHLGMCSLHSDRNLLLLGVSDSLNSGPGSQHSHPTALQLPIRSLYSIRLSPLNPTGASLPPETLLAGPAPRILPSSCLAWLGFTHLSPTWARRIRNFTDILEGPE